MSNLSVKVSRTFGNFEWAGTFDVPEAAVESLVAAGIVRTIQSKPSGAVEKALAGYSKRPEKFQRTDIAFTAENAEALKKAFSNVELKFETVGTDGKAVEQKVELVSSDMTVVQYTPSTAGEPKYAMAKRAIQQYLAAKSTRTVEMFATNREIAVPTTPWEEDMEFLKAAQEYLERELAKQD